MKRALICLFVLGLAAGCSDDDPPPTGPIIPPPPGRDTPRKGVEYYRLAWQDRDSTRIDSVLADDYQGTSIDMGPTTETLTFTKSDEIRVAHNMKNDPNLLSVSVDFGPLSTWGLDSYPGDPPEWVVVIIDNPSIFLQTVANDGVAVSPNRDTVEFKLRPVVSGTDTTWQVVRWKEVHDSR